MQLEYLNKKIPKDFIPGGTTQNEYEYMVGVVKRLGQDIELNGWLQYEAWRAPVSVKEVDLYLPGLQRDTIVAAQLTWFPKLHRYPQP